MKSRKKITLHLIWIMSLCMMSCNKPDGEVGLKEQEKVKLTVFAAASLEETLVEVGNMYMQDNQHIAITFNFDSSGTLKTQIEEGADADIFISAGQKQMNQLDASASTEINTDGLDFVLPGTRLNLLENQVVLAVPKGNSRRVFSYKEMVRDIRGGSLMVAMGNSDVPVGQYTQEILNYYGLKEMELEENGSITYGSNVKELTTQIKEGLVDCGIVYRTDALEAGLEVVDVATKEMCGQVIYPAAVLRTSKDAEEAGEFLTYLTKEEAMEVFKKAGFTSVH